MLLRGRVAEAVLHVVAMCGFTMCFHYVDDFFGVDFEDMKESGYESFIRLHRTVGFQLEPTKTEHDLPEMDLLGLHVDVESRPFKVSVTKLRKKVLSAQIHKVLQAQHLSPAEAGKLAGRVGFAGSGMYGRVGRCFLRTL